MPLPHLKRTVECSTPGTRLSVKNRQLVIQRPDHPTTSVPIEEVGMLIVDDMRMSVTQAVIVQLVESNACVVTTGANHIPVGMTLPFQGISTSVAIQRKQIQLTMPRKKQLWKSIVQAKIQQQSRVLHYFNGADDGLSMLMRKVRSGDTTNVEAHAAQRYWLALFGEDFRRNRKSPGINALLNYGYAIVRAAVARAIVATGLLPSIGLHHHNRSNAFCLADDLLEPFRPFVDQRVKSLANDCSDISLLSLDNRSIRSQLLSVLMERVELERSSTPLSLAIGMCSTSLSRCLTDQESSLVFPTYSTSRARSRAEPMRASKKINARKEIS